MTTDASNGWAVESVLETLERDGVAPIPGVLPLDVCTAVATEAERFLSEPPDAAEPQGYSAGTGYRSTFEAMAGQYPAMEAVFHHPGLKELARRFFGDQPYVLNADVIVTLDVPGTEHAARRPHYDRMPNLKFFLYLVDVDESTGPFCFAPGSQHIARDAQRDNRAKLVLPPQASTRELPDGIPELRPVLGPAGTLFAVNSDVVHSGSAVRRGKRLAMRVRSFDTRYLTQRYASQAPGLSDSPGR